MESNSQSSDDVLTKRKLDSSNISITLTKWDKNTLQKIAQGGHLQEDLEGTRYWHRFLIKNGSEFNKEDLLKLIIARVYPALIIPVKYTVEGKDSHFIANECGAAIIELCRTDLCIYHPYEKKVISFEIILNYMSEIEEPFSIYKTLHKINWRRYDHVTSTLDLTAYHRDPNMKDVFACLLVPKMVVYVLRSSYTYVAKLWTLVLAANDIHSLEDLDCLSSARWLKILDLRNNKLDWEGFNKYPQHVKLKKLYLDGNPLCNGFDNPMDYVRAVKAVVPSLDTLDDINISECSEGVIGLTLIRNSAAKNNTTAKALAEQFVNHYFWLFQTKDREHLVRAYHSKAEFTMTVVSPSQSKGFNVKLYDRNILKMSNYAKIYDLLMKGPEDILKLHNSFPQIAFDKSTFTIDVPYYEEGKSALIIVTGMLKEVVANIGIDISYYFSWSFMLAQCKSNPGEWKITNEMLALNTPSTQMQQIPFKNYGLREDWPSIENFQSRSKEDEQRMVETVRKLTTMDTIWCKKFLDDASWDLEKTLLAFTDQYKTQLIPAEAFIS